jgi:hypothetical protein
MELVKMFLLMALMVTIAAAYHRNGPRETGLSCRVAKAPRQASRSRTVKGATWPILQARKRERRAVAQHRLRLRRWPRQRIVED